MYKHIIVTGVYIPLSSYSQGYRLCRNSVYCIELYVKDTAHKIVQKLFPSPWNAAPRARTRTAESVVCLTLSPYKWSLVEKADDKKGRRQKLSALHWERNARQRNKLHPKAAMTKTKHGLALYMASFFQVANRGKNGSSVKCARNGPTSSAHQATTGSFVPTVNQTRTRTVTSCHVISHIMSCNVISHSNGENIM